MDSVEILKKILRIMLIIFLIFWMFCALLAFFFGDRSFVNVLIFCAFAFFLTRLLKKSEPAKSKNVKKHLSPHPEAEEMQKNIFCKNSLHEEAQQYKIDTLENPPNQQETVSAEEMVVETESLSALPLPALPEKELPPVERPEPEKAVRVSNTQDIIINELDPLFVRAGRFAVEKDVISVGTLQRAFRVGFNRAQGIIAQLSNAGVIGSADGTLKQKPLMTREDFESMISHPETISIMPETDCRNDSFAPLKAPERKLSERISWYNNKFDYMEGHDFEEYCAFALRNIGFQSVEVTKKSGDQGIDIIAYKNGVKYGIQCKCYSSNIGNSAVQEALSGARYYDCHVPVVLTNQHFTRSAKDLAKKTNVLLWDRDVLSHIVKASERENTNHN